VENPLAEETILLKLHTAKLRKAGASRNALKSVEREIRELPLHDPRQQGSRVTDIHRFLNSLAVSLHTNQVRTGADGKLPRAVCTTHGERLATGQRRITFLAWNFLCSECFGVAKREDDRAAEARVDCE
jgi:hypothetical protein